MYTTTVHVHVHVLLFGLGVEPLYTYEKARRLYQLAAQQGEVSAMANSGVMYEHGEGVEQSYKRAFEYYEQAAHLGQPTHCPEHQDHATFFSV